MRAVGGNIELDIADARTDTDETCSALITLETVSQIKTDGEIADVLSMEAASADVWTLDISEDGMKLIVEWNDWEPRRQFVRCYEIAAKKVRVSIASSG